MAIAAPLALAGVGAAGFSAAGLAATTGASVGWLVGSWLWSPQSRQKNRIFDPGAEELPRPSQALRGATIPILFGTNRVAPNIVVRENLTTLRHETKQSQGGGKGGGSGAGGKQGGGGSVNVSYTYKVDLVYHLGFVPEEVAVWGGWLGSERLSGQTTAALLNNGGAVSAGENEDGVGLTFDEGFFYNGQGTDGWDHLQTITASLPVRWPNTSWVGFKQLLLGSQPRIPQISFEVGPGDPVAEFDAERFARVESSAEIRDDYFGMAPPSKTLVSSLIIRAERNSGHVICYNNSGELRWFIDNDFMITMLESFAGTDVVSANPLSDGVLYGAAIRDKAIVSFRRQKENQDFWYWFAVFDPDVDTPSIQGAVRFLDEQRGFDAPRIFDLDGLKEDDDRVIVTAHYETDDMVAIAYLPPLDEIEANAFVGGFTEDSTVITTEPYHVPNRRIEFDFSENLMVANKGGGSFGRLYSFALPFVDGLNIKTHMYFHIGAAYTDVATDESLANQWVSADVPNEAGVLGALYYADITSLPPLVDSSGNVSQSATEVFSKGSMVLANSDTIDMPWEDEGKRFSDSASTSNAYYNCRPSAQKLDGGGFLVSFVKPSFDSEDNNNQRNGYCGIRLYTYNPISGTFTGAGSFDGVIYTNEDWNVSSSAADGGYDDSDIFAMYNETDGELFLQSGLGTSNLDNVDEEDGGALYITKFANVEISGTREDRTPPFIIREMLRSPIFGLGVSSGDIDDDSYNTANQYCEANSYFVSAQFRRSESAASIIELLLATYGGFLTQSGGKLKFGLQRFGNTVVRTLDNTHFVVDEGDSPVSVTEGSIDDTSNYVKVNYYDRSLGYLQNFVEIGDEFDQEINGVRPMEFPPRFVMSEVMASKMAERALWSNLYAKRQLRLRVGWKDADLEPGDTVVVVDSHSPLLDNGIKARIVVKDEKAPGDFALSLIEEQEFVDEPQGWVHDETDVATTPVTGTPRFAQDFIMGELPAEFEGEDKQLYVWWANGGELTAGAKLYLSSDNLSFAQALDVNPYPIFGRIMRELPADQGFVEDVEVFINPASGFNASSPTFTNDVTLDDVGATGRAQGAGNIWVGSEMMAYEGINLLGQNHYRFDRLYRGVGATHTHAHNSGDIFYKHAGGVFVQAYNEDRIFNTVYYKVVPYNFAGVEVDVSSVTAKEYQIRGTRVRPQIAPPLHIWNSSEDFRGVDKFAVDTGDITVEWEDASRTAGFGFQGYGIGGFGRFTTDTASTQYRVEITGSGDVVVRSTVVSTVQFDYTRAQNVSDNGAFRGNIAVKVTPFNDFGDALRSQVRSLQFFER